MRDDMNTANEEIIERLVDANVLLEADHGESFVLTKEFRALENEKLTALEERDESSTTIFEEQIGRIEEGPAEPNLENIARAEVLAEMVDGMTVDEGFSIARGFHVFETRPEEVPDGFVPLEFNEISTFLKQYDGAVLYVWRRDCPPCDTVRDRLEQLLKSDVIPRNLGLGAVCGPDCVTVLREQYDATVAPTLLFCIGTKVDSRLVGAHDISIIQHEIEMIEKLS